MEKKSFQLRMQCSILKLMFAENNRIARGNVDKLTTAINSNLLTFFIILTKLEMLPQLPVCSPQFVSDLFLTPWQRKFSGMAANLAWESEHNKTQNWALCLFWHRECFNCLSLYFRDWVTLWQKSSIHKILPMNSVSQTWTTYSCGVQPLYLEINFPDSQEWWKQWRKYLRFKNCAQTYTGKMVSLHVRVFFSHTHSHKAEKKSSSGN